MMRAVADRGKAKSRQDGWKHRASSPGLPPGQTEGPRGLWSDPEWEAAKSSCRNISHADGVCECDFLSNQYRRMWKRMTPFEVEPRRIIEALRAKKISFVLTGAHGIAGWTGRPRATKDVDILVQAGRNHTRAVNAIKTLYPQLEVRRFSGVAAFFVPGETESVIDISYPRRADNEETLRTGTWIANEGLRYRIPALEAALANKHGAMLSLGRDPHKRGQDAIDFAWMVRHSTEAGRKPINLERLAALGEMVWPGDGGAEIVRLVEQSRAGKMPDLNDPGGRAGLTRD